MKRMKKLLTIVMMAALVLTMTVPQAAADAFAAAKSSAQKTIDGIEDTTIKAKTELTAEGKIKVSWTKSKGYKVDYYQVYRSTSKNGTYKKVFTTKSGSKTSYTNTSVKEGTRYYYKVRGVRKINGKNYYTQWSNKANRTAASPASTVNIKFKHLGTIDFNAGEEAYRDSNGNVMVSIEAIAEYFDAELEMKDGNTYAVISQTWEELEWPYEQFLAGGICQGPVRREIHFKEGSLEGEYGKNLDVKLSPQGSVIEEIVFGNETFTLTAKPVLKNGKLYVELGDVADALCLEFYGNSENTEYTLVPYKPWNIRYYWDRITTTSSYILLQNEDGISKAEILRIDLTDKVSGKIVKNTTFKSFDNLSTLVTFDDLGLDISTALGCVKYTVPSEIDSSYDVSFQVKLTKTNNAAETTWLSFTQE